MSFAPVMGLLFALLITTGAAEMGYGAYENAKWSEY